MTANALNRSVYASLESPSSAQTVPPQHARLSPAQSRVSLSSEGSFEDIELQPLLSASAQATAPHVATHNAVALPRQPRVTFARIALPDPPSYVAATGIYHAEDHFELGPAYPGARALHVGNWMGLRLGLLARSAFNMAVTLPGYALASIAVAIVMGAVAHITNAEGAKNAAYGAEVLKLEGIDTLVDKIGNDFARAISASPDQNRRVVSHERRYIIEHAAHALVGLPFEKDFSHNDY